MGYDITWVACRSRSRPVCYATGSTCPACQEPAGEGHVITMTTSNQSSTGFSRVEEAEVQNLGAVMGAE